MIQITKRDLNADFVKVKMAYEKKYDEAIEKHRNRIASQYNFDPYSSAPIPTKEKMVGEWLNNYKEPDHIYNTDTWLNPTQVVSIKVMKNSLTDETFVRVKMSDGNEYDDVAQSAEEFFMRQGINGEQM